MSLYCLLCCSKLFFICLYQLTPEIIQTFKHVHFCSTTTIDSDTQMSFFLTQFSNVSLCMPVY